MAWKKVMTENLGTANLGKLPAKTIVGRRTDGSSGSADALSLTDILSKIGLSNYGSETNNVNIGSWAGSSSITSVGTITTGQLKPSTKVAVAKGGMGLTSIGINSIVVGNGTSDPVAIASSDNTIMITTATNPAFRKLNLATDTDLLPTITKEYGGTGLTLTTVTDGLLLRNSANTLFETVAYADLPARLGLSPATHEATPDDIANHRNLFQGIQGQNTRSGYLSMGGKTLSNFGLAVYSTLPSTITTEGTMIVLDSATAGKDELYIYLNVN